MHDVLLLFSLLANVAVGVVVLMDHRERKRLEKMLTDREAQLLMAVEKFREFHNENELKFKKLHDTVGDMTTKISAISANIAQSGGIRR